MSTFADAIQAKRSIEDRLLAIPGVHTVGVGGKATARVPTGEVAIRVQVTKKRPLSDIPPDERIPEIVLGVKTDVVESGSPVTYSTLQGGVTITTNPTELNSASGTLGCFARTTDATPIPVLLSNDHVLYGIPGQGPRANDGDPVTIETSSGCATKTVASLLRTGGPNNPLIDAAIAKLASATQWAAKIHDVAVTGTLDFSPENIHNIPQAIQDQITNFKYFVNKFGGASELKRGYISDIAAKTIAMNNQLEVAPVTGDYFSIPGDSGSAIYDDNGKFIALLWGGDPLDKSNPDYHAPPWNTRGSHIAYVQSQLNIVVATNEPAVVYQVGGKPQLHPALARVYGDLSASGRQREFIALYRRHSTEIRNLLKRSRLFIVAWHRNHGPKIVRSLSDLSQGRLGALPVDFDGRRWADCVKGIEGALITEGSLDLKSSVRRYRQIACRLGGRSYQEVLGFLLTSEDATAGSRLSRGDSSGGDLEL
jgi:hypothetical protein